MASFTRMEVYNAVYDIGLVPVFYHRELQPAKGIVEACAAAGARVVEFTNRGDFAYRIFSELARFCQESLPHVILGVGSVIDPATAALYINNGANFVVGPVLSKEVAMVCNRRKIPYCPGCGSVSEISEAESLGVEIVKIFPGGQVGGPAFVKSVMAPMPWSRLMPTGGVTPTRESVGAWIEAGAACLGMGSKLISKDLVAHGRWDALTRSIQDCLELIREARGEALFTGVEHVGLYPQESEALARWYAETFGFRLEEGDSYFFAASTGPGRIEILKRDTTEKAHVAIRVRNFEAACEVLRARGIELEEPRDLGRVKLVYLKDPDPGGYRVHLYYRL